MGNWREHYIDALSNAPSESDLFETLKNMAFALGFEHCSYGIRTPLPASAPQFFLFSNYAEAWSQRYIENNYFSIDPTVQHALTQKSPLQWSIDKPTANAEFWEEAQQHQLRHGWCMPAHGLHGTIGLLSFVRSAEKITAKELDTKENQMFWLTTLAHSAMSQLIAPKLMPECLQSLTPREREVLRWTAAGKTYGEMAIILSIDGRTVKFHLSNAMRKMHAINKAQAAFKAAMLGLLY